ncbi:hypothetical protein Tco_0298211, partial [Tanacetum coccineum]
DPSEEHEPEDDDNDDDTDDEDEEPTEDAEEEEEHPAPADSSMVPVVDLVPSTGDTEAFETDESAPTLDIPEEDMPPWRRYVLTAPPPRCDVAKSSAASAAKPPRGQYDLVDTIKA